MLSKGSHKGLLRARMKKLGFRAEGLRLRGFRFVGVRDLRF